MSQKVIVTGAAGFIASHLCEALLDKGHRVVGVDAFKNNYDVRIKRDNAARLVGRDGFDLVEGSLNDIDLTTLLTGAAVVFHLAAQPGVRQSWHEQFDEYVNANIRATQRLCDESRKHQLKRFVYASSSSVYGETTSLPMAEDHPTRPYSPYGVTKLSGENLCLLYRANYQLPVVALRFFTVYGPRQRADMAFHRFIARALDGKPIEVYGNGTQTRDFTYVADVVDANLAAMEYSGEVPVFNIGGGAQVALNTALDLLLKSLPEHAEVHYHDPVRGDVSNTYADIALAARELGYAPKMGLEEGLHREVEWLKALRRGMHGGA